MASPRPRAYSASCLLGQSDPSEGLVRGFPVARRSLGLFVPTPRKAGDASHNTARHDRSPAVRRTPVELPIGHAMDHCPRHRRVPLSTRTCTRSGSFLANSSMRARSSVRTFLKFAGCPEATGPDRSEIEVFGVTSRYQGVVIVWHAIDRAR